MKAGSILNAGHNEGVLHVLGGSCAASMLIIFMILQTAECTVAMGSLPYRLGHREILYITIKLSGIFFIFAVPCESSLGEGVCL